MKEDFVFNDTMKGPRASAVKPGRLTQVLNQESVGAKKIAPRAAPRPGIRLLRRHLQSIPIPFHDTGRLCPGWLVITF